MKIEGGMFRDLDEIGEQDRTQLEVRLAKLRGAYRHNRMVARKTEDEARKHEGALAMNRRLMKYIAQAEAALLGACNSEDDG